MLYFFFELSIVPILLLIMGYGYQVERLQAARYLIIYTMLCSLPFIFLRIKFFAINNTLYFFPTYCSRFSFLFKTLILVVFFVKLPIFFTPLMITKSTRWSSNSWFYFISCYFIETWGIWSYSDVEFI